MPSAARALRRDGVLCAFSPCIEQVQRTCEALEASGFGDAQTLELLGREHDVETRDMQRSLARSQPKLQNKWQREAKQKAKRKRAGAADRGDGDGDGDGTGTKRVARGASCRTAAAGAAHAGCLTFARLVPYATAEEAAAARAAGRARRGQNGGRRTTMSSRSDVLYVLYVAITRDVATRGIRSNLRSSRSSRFRRPLAWACLKTKKQKKSRRCQTTCRVRRGDLRSLRGASGLDLAVAVVVAAGIMEYSRHKEGEPDARGTRSMMEIHADAQRQAMQEAGLGALRRLVPKSLGPDVPVRAGGHGVGRGRGV